MRDGDYDELMEEAQQLGLSPRQAWRAIAGARGSYASARSAVERMAEGDRREEYLVSDPALRLTKTEDF